MHNQGEPARGSDEIVDRASVDFSTAYSEIRKRLRKYRLSSVVERAFEVLWQPASNPFDALSRAPWQVLLLVKWALLDVEASEDRGRKLPMVVFDDIRQQLFSFPNRVDGVRRGSMPSRLFMRRLFYQQAEFQRAIGPDFVRQPAILADLLPAHPLRTMFRQKTGLDVLDFMDLTLAVHGFIAENKSDMSHGWFQPIQGTYGHEKLHAFTRCISADLPQLRMFLMGRPGAAERVASEYYEFTPLKRYPFWRAEEIHRCWHSMVLYRGMEDFAHLLMSEAGAKYVQRFSKVFERYVVAELKRSDVDHYDETALRRIFGASVELPDAVIPMGGYNVIVEAKAGLFDDVIMAIGDPEILRHRTKSLTKAIEQGWSAAVAFRSGHAPANLKDATEDYLFVVTNKPLNVGSGADLKALYPEGRLSYPSEEARALLPLERIYFVSIGEFECLVASGIASDARQMHDFLRECVRLDADPATGKYFFDDHLQTFPGSSKGSRFLTAAMDAALERVERAIGVGN